MKSAIRILDWPDGGVWLGDAKLRSIHLAAFVSALSLLVSCKPLDTVGNLPDAKSAGSAFATYYLPRSVVKITVLTTKTAVQIKAVPEFKGEDRPLYVVYNHSIFSDDQVCVSRDAMGLLSHVGIVTNDRTLDILVNVAEIAAKFIRSAAVRSTGAEDAPKEIVSVSVDTGDDNTIRAAEIAIKAALTLAGYEKVKVDLSKLNMDERQYINNGTVTNQQAYDALMRGRSPKTEYSSDGRIHFRTLTRRPIIINYSKEGIKAGAAVEIIEVVNRQSTSYVNTSRAFGVEKITEIRFKNGILVGMRVREGSEALALSEFPLKVLDRIMTVPANFVARLFGPSPERLKLQQQQAAAQQKAAEVQKAREAQRNPSTGFVTFSDSSASKPEKDLVTCAIK